jgi:DNA relaxase NicK
LELFAVDALEKVHEDGSREYVIIELNGTACGFQTDSWRADSETLAKELMGRLTKVVENQGKTVVSPRQEKLFSLSKFDKDAIKDNHK